MGVSRVRVDGVCQRCHGAACQMSSGSARGGTVWVIKGKEEERRWLSFSYGLSLLKWSYTYSFATTKLTKRLLWRANWADRDDLCSNPHLWSLRKWGHGYQHQIWVCGGPEWGWEQRCWTSCSGSGIWCPGCFPMETQGYTLLRELCPVDLGTPQNSL